MTKKTTSEVSKEEVVLASDNAMSMKELISNLGGSLSEAILSTMFPGLEFKFKRNRIVQQMSEAKARGDSAELHALNSEFMPLSGKVLDYGLSNQQLGMVYKAPIKDTPVRELSPKKATKSNTAKAGKVAKSGKDIDISNLQPLADGDFVSEVMSKYVKGYSDRTFKGRRVVVLSRVPGLFGCQCVKKVRLQEYSLHNGILNQSDLKANGNPTPYWAIIDAMSELKENFIMDNVLDQAVKILDGDESQREACKTAWYVLKTHATHPTKKHAGYCYMLEPLKGSGPFNIRARLPNETFEYFMEKKNKKKKEASPKKKSTVAETVQVKPYNENVDEEQPLATVQVAEVS